VLVLSHRLVIGDEKDEKLTVIGPADRIEELGESADVVVCVETPPAFRAVGAYYERFDQVSDEEAIEYLE